jgi:hypothetical protein
MFAPSEHSYGADDNSSSSDTPSTLDKLSTFFQQAAPALSVAQELIGKTDAEKPAILRARIANYRLLMHKQPYATVPGTAWYQAEIRKMQAQASALAKSAAAEADATQDYSIWRKLTSVGGLVGIAAGSAVVYYLVKKAQKP